MEINPLGEPVQSNQELVADILAQLMILERQRTYLLELLEHYENPDQLTIDTTADL